MPNIVQHVVIFGGTMFDEERECAVTSGEDGDCEWFLFGEWRETEDGQLLADFQVDIYGEPTNEQVEKVVEAAELFAEKEECT
jgi:hypothetical protein